MRLVRSWTTLMILAGSRKPLTAREVHDRLCANPEFAHVEMKLQTTREYLKTLLKCQFPVAMVDEEGREIRVDGLGDLRGRLKNIRWCIRGAGAVRELVNVPARPTVSDIAALRLMHELLVMMRAPGELLRGPFSEVIQELLLVYQNQMAIDEVMGGNLLASLEKIEGRLCKDPDLKEKLLTLGQAVIGNNIVRISYSEDGRRSTSNEIVPRRFYVSRGLLYLVALKLPDNELRSYRIDRMGPLLSLLARPAPEVDQHRVDEFIRQGFGESLTRVQTVRLRVAPCIAGLFRETTFHSTQELTELADETVEVRLQCSTGWAFEEWLLAFGEHVRVLEPTSLANQVRKRHQAAADAYSDLPCDAPPEDVEESEYSAPGD